MYEINFFVEIKWLVTSVELKILRKACFLWLVEEAIQEVNKQ